MRLFFGLTDQYPIFDQRGKTSCIGLYFDISKEVIASLRLISQIHREIQQLQPSINLWKSVEVAEPLREYVEINAHSHSSVICHMEAWQDKLNTQVFLADDMSAQEIYKIYQLQEVSSKQFER